MMGFLDSIGGALRLRRKKTLADRVEDTAERAVEAVRDVYSAALDSLNPVLERSGKVADRAGSRAHRAYSATVDSVAPVLARTTGAADRTVSRARDAYESGVDSLEPVLEKSMKVAEQAWRRTAKRTAAGLSTAGDLATDAATTVGHTGKAAAGAVGEAAVATGSVLGTVFAWVWKASVFLFKAALLAGVAYVGWQWLQSRREEQTWNTPGTSSYGSAGAAAPTGSSGTPAWTPSTTYGSVGSAPGS
jgi:hypothetical protein